MQAKSFRGDIWDLERNLNEFLEQTPTIKNFQMFPVGDKYESELNEPFYEIMILYE